MIQWIKNFRYKLEGLKFEKKYNSKYPKTDIVYMGRPLNKKLIEIDVRNFYNLNDASLIKIVKSIRDSNMSDDDKAYWCLIWVMNNIEYISDKEKGHHEFWQFPFETLNYMTGDCEDGAILLANLMQIAGIPYWKIRLTTGNVKLNNKLSGHAYVTYFCQETEKWVILDWCYWPHYQAIKERMDYKDERNYKGVWFSWNSRYCFHGGTK